MPLRLKQSLAEFVYQCWSI